MIKKVSFKEAKEIMDSEKDYILLDVRAEEEYITGHAVDAVLFPLDEITDVEADDVIPSLDTTILVYCRTGRRSAEAARLLDDFGYETIYDIGGLVGWPYGLVI